MPYVLVGDEIHYYPYLFSHMGGWGLGRMFPLGEGRREQRTQSAITLIICLQGIRRESVYFK